MATKQTVERAKVPAVPIRNMDLVVLGMLSCIPSLDGGRLIMSRRPRTRRARKSLVRVVGLALLPVLIVTASLPEESARASGFLTDQFGSDRGQPALPSAYSVYFNPAAMAGLDGSQLTVDGVIAAREVRVFTANVIPHVIAGACL